MTAQNLGLVGSLIACIGGAMIVFVGLIAIVAALALMITS